MVEVASHLLQEVTSQRAYLQRLMALVLTNVPWLLDDMDDLPSTGADGGYDDEDGTEDDSYSVDNESDDEVWC